MRQHTSTFVSIRPNLQMQWAARPNAYCYPCALLPHPLAYAAHPLAHAQRPRYPCALLLLLQPPLVFFFLFFRVLLLLQLRCRRPHSQLDRRFEGATREMMVVSYYRYKGASTISNVDDVCRLVRTTGWSNAPDAKKPANYPIDYFARFPIMPEVLQMVVGRLRAEDIYNQVHISVCAPRAPLLCVRMMMSRRMMSRE